MLDWALRGRVAGLEMGLAVGIARLIEWEVFGWACLSRTRVVHLRRTWREEWAVVVEKILGLLLAWTKQFTVKM